VKGAAETKPRIHSQQRFVEEGPVETVESMLAEVNASANERLAAFLASDNSRIAAAANEDDDEEMSTQVPIPEDDDGHSYHNSDEDSGNEEPAAAVEREVTTPSGWKYTDGPDPCLNTRHRTVGVSTTSPSTHPPIKGLFGAPSTMSRTPAISAPATHAQVYSNGMIVPPNGQHAHVRPDARGRVSPITAPDFQRTTEGPCVVPNAHNSVQSHVQGRDGQPVLTYHPSGTTVAFNDHGVLILLNENPDGPGMTLEAFATHAGGSVHAPPAWHGTHVPAPTLQHTLSLVKLSNFRIGQGELVSAFCSRLRELFEELEELEGDHAFVFNDTQRLGYLFDCNWK
jgi:hypothetical protein